MSFTRYYLTCNRASWYRVVAGAAKGIAAQDSFQRKPSATERTILKQRFFGVLGAGRRVATGGGSERRDAGLIEFDEEQKKPHQPFFEQGPHTLQTSAGGGETVIAHGSFSICFCSCVIILSNLVIMVA